MRAGEVDFTVDMAHAAAEIAIRRRDAALAGSHDAHVAAEARAAGRRRDGTAGIDERIDVATLHRLLVDGRAARDDDAAHAVCDLVALEDGRRNLHVLEAAVRAGTDDDLIDLDWLLDILDALRVARQVREGDDWLELGEVDVDFAAVLSVIVGCDRLVRLRDTGIDISLRDLVEREDAGLAARLDGHVGDGQAVRHRQGLDARASELEGLVERAVDANHADERQDDVLAGDVGRLLARQVDLDGLRHLEPGLARRHGCAEVSRADARREAVDGAVRARMRIRANRQHARCDDALLRQDDVLDAHAALLEIVDDLVLACEIAYDLRELCRLDVLGRLEVVRHERDLRVIEDRTADLLEFRDGRRCRDVVREYHIELTGHELTGLHGIEASVFRENLLAHSHTHSMPS